jgi:hypothetical protein
MFRSISKAVGAVAVLFAVGACADPVSPKAEVDGPAFASGLITINGADLFLASGAGNTTYCGFSGANVFNTEVPCPGVNTIAPVVTNLNPGWADYTPTGSFIDADWLGPVANSDDYVNLPGTYTYTRTFTIPAGTTNLQMNMQVLADNNTTVEVNGIVIGSQPQTDNTFSIPVDFNATSELQVGLNTLTFIVNNTRVDATPVGSPCPNTPAFYPQPAYDNVACRNPTGFLYTAVVGWELAVQNNYWCSPGYWKNAQDAAWDIFPNDLATRNVLYNSINGSMPDFGDNPTIWTVLNNPSTYKGPATNTVANYLAGLAGWSGTQSSNTGCPLNNHGAFVGVED